MRSLALGCRAEMYQARIITAVYLRLFLAVDLKIAIRVTQRNLALLGTYLSTHSIETISGRVGALSFLNNQVVRYCAEHGGL